jgi:hypothetical protein
MHRGVDRRRRTALAVQAVVEGGDHLILALDSGIDVHQLPHPIKSQHRQAGLRQGPQVPAGTLHPEQFNRLTGDRVGLSAFGRCVASGVVGVLGV